MLKKLFSTILFTALCTFASYAQEMNCKVKVMADRIQGIDKEVFASLQRNITEFINTRKWTSDQFQNNERIDCNILINLTGQIDQDVFEATFNIQATRPIFNTGYTSPLINYVDKDFKFKYNQYTPLQFDDNRVAGNDALASNLTAMLAYYIYLTIALDYDSYSPNGGSDYYKKAQNVVNNAPEQSKIITGWKAVDGNKNRYWLMDQILSPRFKEFRSIWYNIHRQGLDKMTTAPQESRRLILETLPRLQVINRENPSSILLQFFFNAKCDEFVGMVSQEEEGDKKRYVSILQQVDVANIQKYNNIK